MKNKLLLLTLFAIYPALSMQPDTKLSRSLRGSGLSDKDLTELEQAIDDIYAPSKRACGLGKTCKFLVVSCFGAVTGPLISARLHQQFDVAYTGQWVMDEAIVGGVAAAFVYDQILKEIERSESDSDRARMRALLKRRLGKME